MPRGTDTGCVDGLFHSFLVAERHRLLDRHSGHPKRLADPRGKEHVRLPQALDLVDGDVPGESVERAEYGTLIAERHVLVVGKRVSGHVRQRRRRLVTDSNNRRTYGRERSSEIRHLNRVTGREHHNIHWASTSSTRSALMMRRR